MADIAHRRFGERENDGGEVAFGGRYASTFYRNIGAGSHCQSDIGAISGAIAAGVDVCGYMLWSLLDNLEWSWVIPNGSASSMSIFRPRSEH